MMTAIRNVADFLQNRVLGHLVLTFGTSTALQGMAILTGIITARVLGPTGKGQLTAVVVWFVLLIMLGSLGIVEAINYFTASKQTEQGIVLATGITIGLFQSIFLIAIAWWFTPLVLRNQGEEVISLGKYIIFIIPCYLFTIYLNSYLSGRLQFNLYNINRSVGPATILLGVVFLYFTGKVSVQNVIIVHLLANMLGLMIAFLCVKVTFTSRYVPSRHLAGSMLAYGIKAHSSNVTMMFNERFDQLFIAMLLPAIQLGYYAAAVSLTTGVVVIGTSVAIVALPVVAKNTNTEARADNIATFFRVNFWLSVASALILILISYYLILFLFGEAYLPAVNATQILLLAAVPLSCNRVMQAALKSSDLPLHAGLAELVAAALTVVLLIFLLPAYGIIGAAITSLVAYTTSGVYMLWFIQRKVGCNLVELFVPKAQDFRYVTSLLRAS